MSWGKIVLLVVTGLILCGGGVGYYFYNFAEFDIYVPLYADNCSQCHGSALEGSHFASALVGRELSNGDSVPSLVQSMRDGHPQLAQPGFVGVLNDVEIKGLAIYVGERRLGQRFMDFRFDSDFAVPGEVQHSEAHDFVIQTLVDGLDPMVFSIEPLPNGSLLLTEKERGLSLISPDGEQSELIRGTPETGSSIDIKGVQYGSGWLLDVVAHPDYAENGWIYLQYTDLCEGCAGGITARSMNRVDRGRIVEGQWVDVQTIWQTPQEFYLSTPDTGAGGRLAFDDENHLYISIGTKSEDGLADTTPQDLDMPYGKIHRVMDDGSIPLDNPFTLSGAAEDAPAVRRSIWTYGHRSPQGLEWHPGRQRVWNSEMGPRGGDELNELLPGKNYGWPYFSLGLEYVGDRVERHKAKAIEFDANEIEQTLVDITPSPAISSFAIYSGSAFPEW